MSKLVITGLLSAWLLTACLGSSGGDSNETATRTGANNAGFTRSPATLLVDGDIGSDANTVAQATVGGGGPWKSIQHALDQAQPGDVIQVQWSPQPYAGVRSASAVDPAGIVIDVSGEPGLTITLEGVPDFMGRRPVIDQGRTAPDDTSPVAGLLLSCVSHVTVRGFEILQVNDAGITTSLSGCGHENLTIEDNVIHDVTGVGYVAGIRLVQTRNSLVRGNEVRDIVASTTLTVSDPLRLVSSTVPTEDNVVEWNDIDNVAVAVHIRGRGTQALSDHRVARNRIHDVETGLLLTADTAQPASIDDTTFRGNLIFDADLASDEGRAVDAQLGTSGVQSNGLDIALNTVVNVDQPVRLAGVTGVRAQENILVNADVELLVSVAPQSPGILNGFDFIDNNLYFDNAAMAWTLAGGGPSEVRFLSLATWRQASSVTVHPDLVSDPDLLAVVSDPLFNNPALGDFSLPINSPARILGLGGGQIGAYFDDTAPGAP